MQDQLLKVYLSYLRLLVNSRDELALSQAINIPHRDLAHKQFTALRKVARERNMPMFQVSMDLGLEITIMIIMKHIHAQLCIRAGSWQTSPVTLQCFAGYFSRQLNAR